jgi:phenylacetate-CoA ligase
LTRKEFSSNYSQLRNHSFSGADCQAASTSGTTGNALEFLHRAEDSRREWAAICHQWKRVGYDPGRSRRAEFRGLTPRGHLFQSYPDHNMVRFSVLDIRKETVPRMAEVIEKEDLRFFHGYPSVLYLLACELLRSGIRFPQPTAVLFASEMVFDFQVEQVQAAFPKARLFAHYGCAERTVLAGWCEHRRAYHVLPQYSLTEVDPETHELIGTNLFNDINGFIRYRMTDTASGVEAKPCPACNRPYTPVLASIDGRQEDYLYSKDVGWISPAIVTYPLKHLHCVHELQFRQDTPEEIGVSYVLRPGATPDAATKELAEIETGLRRIIGQAPRLRFQAVGEIARGRSGKYKWIVSKLDPPR